MPKFIDTEVSPVSDEQLCQQALAGDRVSEETLVMRYTQLVRCISRPLFLMGADQEDLIQEGMIGLTKAIHKFDSDRGASFRTFAAHCIHRRMLSAIRDASGEKHQALNSALSLDEEPQEHISSYDDPECRMLDSDAFQERLKDYQSRLSVFENQVLDLYLQGFTRQEISKRLSCSVKSVDNALQRIRTKLRASFSR